jgi:glycosyltransferase involved in cell wall biosynthesis
MLDRSRALYDTRVRKEAEALAAAGYDVRVLTRVGEGVAAGVTYLRVAEPRRRRRRGRREADAPTPAARVPEGPVRRRIHRLARRLAKRYLHPLLRQSVRPRKRVRKALRQRPPRNPWLDPLRYARAADLALAGWQPDVVHAHDLSTLFAARRYARRHRASLIYDSHELELDAKRRWRRSERLAAVVVERAGVRAAAAVVTVSDAIARVLAERYGIPVPLVLLNSPWLRAAAGEPLPVLRADLGPDAKVIAYVGGVWAGRGLEDLLEALTHLPEVYVLAILGERREPMDEKLRRRARELGVLDRLRLHDPVPAPLVPAVLAAADVSALPIQNSHLSHYYAMPNKLFDAVMAGVPLAVADLPEMARFVTERELGAVFDERDPVSIARVLRAVVEDPPAGVRNQERLRAVQAEVAWERQAEKLLALYERLAPVSAR